MAIADEILKLLIDVYMRGMVKKPTIDGDEVVDGKLLAQRLGLTATSLSRLATYGALAKAARGRYYLWGSVQAYLKHRDKEAASRASPASTARAELLKIQAARSAFAFAAERGEMVRWCEIETALAAFLRELRASLLALPARLAGRCGLSREAAEFADAEVRSSLNAFADSAHSVAMKVDGALIEARNKETGNGPNRRGADARHRPASPRRAAAS